MLPPPPAEAFETEIMNTAEFRPSPGMTARRSTDPNWAPVEYIERVKAVYDYEADNHDELTFDEDAIIYVVAKNEGMFQYFWFQFRWLKIEGFDVAPLISITRFSNHLK